MMFRFIVILFFIIFSFNLSAKCRLKKNSYVSFSGPITHFLKELKILSDPSLKAISSFSMIQKDEFGGDILGGGLLISPKYLKNYPGAVVFFDNSREIKRALQRIDKVKGIEVSTRGLDAFASFEKSKEILRPYLEGCEVRISKIDRDILAIKKSIKQMPFISKRIVFYLGEIRSGEKLPNLAMNRDGFVLSLIDAGKLDSYPSTLKYVSWSEKVINGLKKNGNLLEVGLVPNEQFRTPIVKKVAPQSFNIYSDTMLIPGLPQVRFLQYMVNKWLVSKDFSSTLRKI